jgi:hypothetical protein
MVVANLAMGVLMGSGAALGVLLTGQSVGAALGAYVLASNLGAVTAALTVAVSRPEGRPQR